MSEKENTIQFQRIHALIEPSFWPILRDKKLNDLRLSEDEFSISVFFSSGNQRIQRSFVIFNNESFTGNQQTPSHYLSQMFPISSKSFFLNTKVSFKNFNKKLIFSSVSDSIMKFIKSKDWLTSPESLLQSIFLVYGDLKKWHFSYIYAFPYPKLNNVKIVSQELFEVPNQCFQSWAFIFNGKEFLPLSEATSESIFCYIDPLFAEGIFGWNAQSFILAISLTFSIKIIKLLRINHNPTLYTIQVSCDENVEFSGWTMDNKKPFTVDLSSQMDPKSLFTQASSMNISLMKWRMAPDLDINIFQNQTVLLVGCGTLGCYVSRILLGWGVRSFILIDSGSVSFSNPVRQPLFVFEDAAQKRNKAEAAADELRRVCPDVQIETYKFNVPMPGHYLPQSSSDETKNDFLLFEQLIKRSSVVFMLTDSRESRWLPSLICSALNKFSISIALGFENFSVVRSGSPHLGCYFCNDIIAPVDTITDRTLDMQCTVTRPGIAPLASSIGVELYASVLQVAEKNASLESESVLGTIPQQIRGFLHSWEVLSMFGGKSKNCVACSEKIVEEYLKNGWDFMKLALTDPLYLENLAGITAMKAEMVNIDCEWIDDE